LREWHTLPVDRRVWAVHSGALFDAVDEFEAMCTTGKVSPDTFGEVRDWLRQLLERRAQVASRLLALQPFEPFDHSSGERLVAAIDTCLLELLRAIDCGQPFESSQGAFDEFRRAWPTDAGTEGHELLRLVFGVTDTPVDEEGEFSPSRVFQAYSYHNGRLIQQALPHLQSLGLIPVDDVLAMLCSVGWITAAEDQIVAYASMDLMLSRLSTLLPRAPSVVTDALAHLRHREPALRQSRQRINRALGSLEVESDFESKAHLLADIYKRLVEGPVRQYSWVLRCLGRGTWADPPMLTSLREGLMADGGWLAAFAGSVMLTDLRNGEAHETLAWDGYQRKYLADGTPVDFEGVLAATSTADSFARGCEAALAYHRALDVRPTSGPPSPHEPGRLPAWQRAEAFFGTNNLRLTKSQFNAATAVIRVERFDQEDINPCFQALVCARILLPQIERFEIRRAASGDLVMRVSANALDLTHTIWAKALGSFTAMPLSTFLPANLDARKRLEPESTAVRSVAWIAADDFLDALDGTPNPWDNDDLWMFAERVSSVKIALRQCSAALPKDSRLRIDALLKEVLDAESEIEMLAAPLTSMLIDRMPSTRRIRDFWEASGLWTWRHSSCAVRGEL